ncbi:MAG TPA: LysR family transcriptional regulator [Rhizomicrobium sp.]|nr:LysR family transcriptional regulator [Rhizomicrobium sp.]
MRTTGERPVLVGEQALNPQARQFPDWENAHLFLELVRCRSFRAAADHVGLSVNALRKRISGFEQSLGVTLVTRHVDGVRLTAEGDKILAAANKMEEAARALIQARDSTDLTVQGKVRFGATEGLGTLWIAPNLVEFQRANPKLLLDVNCAMRSADVLRMEVDVAVQLTRPTAQELKVVKLGRLHLVGFAAQSYIDVYGKPRTLADLKDHRIVIQADEDEQWKAMYNRIFPGVNPEGLVSLRTNVSSAHYWSIVNGAGIGMLPTYVYTIGAPLVPIVLEDVDVRVALDIWMTYHVDAARIPRVRRLADLLISSFSPKQFPWFRDEFIPPQDLAQSYKGKELSNPFAGFQRLQRQAG